MTDTSRLRPLGNVFIVGFASATVMDPDATVELANSLSLLPSGTTCPPEILGLVDPMLRATVEASNAQHFRFDLTNLDVGGSASVMHLKSGMSLPGVDAEHSTRKLTVVLPVSTKPTGQGTITFGALDKSRDIVPGTVAVFPSFLAHEFEVPASSELTAIVTYAIGPAFR